MQWTGENLRELKDWTEGSVMFSYAFAANGVEVISEEYALKVYDKFHGWIDASIGDWIVRGVAGEYYPCKDEIKQETYDEGTPMMDALDFAWSLLCNVSEGDWKQQRPDWQAAVERFRDEVWHPLLEQYGTHNAEAALESTNG